MDYLLVVTLMTAFLSGYLSGLAGVGGGFIMAPYWLLIGLSPAQAAATGGALAVSIGASSLSAFRKTDHFPKNKKLVISLIVITMVTATLGAFILPNVDPDLFKTVLAVFTIISLPLIFIQRNQFVASTRHYTAGIIAYTLLAIVSSIIFSAAFNVLITVVFMMLFGLSALQSVALRRAVSLAQAFVLFAFLSLQGNFVLDHAIFGIIGAASGSYFGTKFMIKQGEIFAKYALAVAAAIGAIALLFS